MTVNTSPHRRQLYIAVIGPDGLGKSTFIKTAASLDSIDIGHELKPCATNVRPCPAGTYTFTHEGYDITLIDTPGFYDALRDTNSVLKDVKNSLTTASPEPQAKLTGIIYLQALADRSMYGAFSRHLQMLEELHEEGDVMKNVVLTTTGWGTVEEAGELSTAISNEKHLRSNWEPLIKRGARTARFEDTKESALEIILSFLDRTETALSIDEETPDDDWEPIDKSAGHSVREELKRLEERYRKDLSAVRQEMQEVRVAHEIEIRAAAAQSMQRLEQQREETRKAHDLLEYERRNERRRHENDLQSLRMHLERQRRDEGSDGASDEEGLEPVESPDEAVLHRESSKKGREKEEELYGWGWQTSTPPPEYECN